MCRETLDEGLVATGQNAKDLSRTRDSQKPPALFVALEATYSNRPPWASQSPRALLVTPIAAGVRVSGGEQRQMVLAGYSSACEGRYSNRPTAGRSAA